VPLSTVVGPEPSPLRAVANSLGSSPSLTVSSRRSPPTSAFVIVLAIGFGASQTGVAIADDIASGMIDRFRALPIAGSAVLAGRVAADALRNLFVVGLMVGVASAIGFRFHAGALAAFGAVGLAVGIGVAFSWVNTQLGLIVRDSESAGLAGIFPVVILVFTSSTLVPVSSMPGWLQAFARINPITVVVDALRALSLGGSTAVALLEACAWIVGILVVAVPASALKYRHAHQMRSPESIWATDVLHQGSIIDYRRLSMDIDRNSAEVWASWFRCLSDPSRVLLLNCLATSSSPMTVGQLVNEVDIGQSTVSHHLKVLAETGFVLPERRANTTLFRVNERCLERFPSAAELIMGMLPRYEPRQPDCSAPWQDDDTQTPTVGRRSRNRS
jgi:ABC transporter DrrB family efflux protein